MHLVILMPYSSFCFFFLTSSFHVLTEFFDSNYSLNFNPISQYVINSIGILATFDDLVFLISKLFKLVS